MRKILMATVGCICLLSACAGNLESKCRELNESMLPDIGVVRQATVENTLDDVEFEIGRSLGKVEAALIIGCDCKE